LGQLLHGSARTTEATRLAIQRSQESVRVLAARYGVSPTTVQKWKRRGFVTDARMGPKDARSKVLSVEQEAACIAFRRHTLLPLDDCLYALQPSIPLLTRSSLHRLFQRHDISRLADVRDKPSRPTFKTYAIGYFPIDPEKDFALKSGPKTANYTCSLVSTEPPSSSLPGWKPRLPV
jgi:transposase